MRLSGFARRGLGITAVLLLTSFLVWWMPHRGDYTHVILISTEALQRERLPFYGYGKNTAPHLSALAADSVVFDNASSDTDSLATHIQLFTGQLFTGSSIESPLQSASTLAGLLAEAGFNSGAVVNGAALQGKPTGLGLGFARYDDDARTTGERSAKNTFHAAHRWMWKDSRTRAPAFLFFHATARIDAPKSVDDEVRIIDRWIGELLRQLRIHGYYEHSLIVFTSTGSPRQETDGTAPFLIRFPGDAHAGVRIRARAAPVDVLPTIMDYLELEAPDEIEGKSLLPVILNPNSGA